MPLGIHKGPSSVASARLKDSNALAYSSSGHGAENPSRGANDPCFFPEKKGDERTGKAVFGLLHGWEGRFDMLSKVRILSLPTWDVIQGTPRLLAGNEGMIWYVQLL